MADTVTVRIPADTAHVALLRAAASALAARLDFPIDRITELQIVVDEVCSRLMAVTESPSRITMELRPTEDGIDIEASSEGSRRIGKELLSEWSRVILEAIASDIRPQMQDGRTSLALLVPRAGG
jgi:anti-sigma regulatory factor (Ser/Thr protein kinase)